MKVIATLKRQIVELNSTLNAEREHRVEASHDRTASCSACLTRDKEQYVARQGGRGDTADASAEAVDNNSDALRHTLYELELCKKELEDTRVAFHEACEERECLRVKLSECQTKAVENHDSLDGTHKTKDSHPHLDWVGRHYLAVSLPEDRMFQPGQSVTPVGVLQKLFEMRVGDKPATGFSLLLENINIMLAQRDPEWYGRHFGLCRAYVNGKKYKCTDRVDTEDFAWMLFEYGAHAPLIEVIAGLLNVLNSTGKGGVTTTALCTSKSMHTSYVTLFRDTVSRAYDAFVRVHERAQRVRKAQGVVYMPLTAGLSADRSESQGGSHTVRNTVLRSVLEGIEVPPHIGCAATSTEVHRVSREDPFGLEQSLSAFMKRRCLQGQGKEARSSTRTNTQEHFPLKGSASPDAPGPLVERVLFDSPWPSDSATL